MLTRDADVGGEGRMARKSRHYPHQVCLDSHHPVTLQHRRPANRPPHSRVPASTVVLESRAATGRLCSLVSHGIQPQAPGYPNSIAGPCTRQGKRRKVIAIRRQPAGTCSEVLKSVVYFPAFCGEHPLRGSFCYLSAHSEHVLYNGVRRGRKSSASTAFVRN
jgi:hypothetical protein